MTLHAKLLEIQEERKNISDAELGQYYQISNLGVVRSLGRDTIHKDGRKYYRKGRTIIPSKTNSGYLFVSLTSKFRRFYIHRLVVEAFIGPIPQGMYCNHIDSDKLNNVYTNLEICTPSYNVRHSYKTGTRKSNSVLDMYKANEIRDTYKNNKISQAKLARQYGVSTMVINRIINFYQQCYK